MSMLEKMLGDSWTSETAKAWTELWDSSATAMMKADPGPPRLHAASRTQITRCIIWGRAKAWLWDSSGTAMIEGRPRLTAHARMLSAFL
jgi:hypothetical protein